MNKIKVKRALLSVFNKEKIVELAQFLQSQGVEILSTGGTFTTLKDNGINPIKVEDFTGLKEFFGGRVKTLHPLIHGGILSKRDKESDDLGIKTIDLVVVNLYPFEALVLNGEKDIAQLIEMIDIGGPTMLRSSAKNYKFVTPLCSPKYYDMIIDEIKNGGINEETSFKMAIETFKLTSFYDAVISKTLNQFEIKDDSYHFTNNSSYNKTCGQLTLPIKKSIDMRYGENPHQIASYYAMPDYDANDISDLFTKGKLHGKELSYNNIGDASSCIRMLSDLAINSCVVIKHANPCGAAERDTVYDSFMAAYEGDKTSIFGGIVGVKGTLDEKTANVMSEIFLEIVIAKDFTDRAFEILSKKKNIRLIQYKEWEENIFKDDYCLDIKKVVGGFLVQEKDITNPKNEEFKVVTKASPTPKEIEDLKFAQTMAKHIKSNAIVVVKDKMIIGVGSGQMNRVTSAKIALDWAGSKAKGAVIGSDAFFPMDDTVTLAGERGISAIVQPGGSLKDEESIKKANELGIAMVFTGVRHFLH